MIKMVMLCPFCRILILEIFPIPLIKFDDITTDAMTNLKLLQFKIAQVINAVADGVFDVLNA